MLELKLEKFFTFMLVSKWPIMHLFLLHRRFTMNPLWSIDFFSLSSPWIIFVLHICMVFIPLFFIQFVFSHLYCIKITLPFSIFYNRSPSCCILACYSSTIFLLNLARVYRSLSSILVRYLSYPLSSIYVRKWWSEFFNCFMLWLSSVQYSFELLLL